tara:strand:- start:700 stop:918 length:219 start_codon:yes stop_codon:yes gene_type:complete
MYGKKKMSYKDGGKTNGNLKAQIPGWWDKMKHNWKTKKKIKEWMKGGQEGKSKGKLLKHGGKNNYNGNYQYD